MLNIYTLLLLIVRKFLHLCVPTVFVSSRVTIMLFFIYNYTILEWRGWFHFWFHREKSKYFKCTLDNYILSAAYPYHQIITYLSLQILPSLFKHIPRISSAVYIPCISLYVDGSDDVHEVGDVRSCSRRYTINSLFHFSYS